MLMLLLGVKTSFSMSQKYFLTGKQPLFKLKTMSDSESEECTCVVSRSGGDRYVLGPATCL